MKIAVIELYHVSIPLKETFWPTWIPGYPQTHNRFDLVRLITDDGIEGYSAGPAMGRERRGLGDLLGAYLLGADPGDIDHIQSLLKQAGYLGMYNPWVEAACWDIKAKAMGKPVYELLGGRARPVQLYCSLGEMRAPEIRINDPLRIREAGFQVAKLRVKGRTLAEDVAHIESISRAVGGDISLGVDANQGWRVTIVDRIPAWDLDRATAFARACGDCNIAWLEEPLDSRDYQGNAQLRKVSPVPVSGAELNRGWDEIKIMLEKGCFDIYQPDAVFAGGIAQVMKVAKAAREQGLAYTPHTWTNGIGFHINWSCLLADAENMKPLEYPLEEPSWIPEFRDGIIDPILPDKNGMLQPYTRPGLGFEINKKALKKYGRRYFRITPRRLAFKVLREKGVKQALALKKQKEKSG